MKIAVTGAGGFIGGRLMSSRSARGDRIQPVRRTGGVVPFERGAVDDAIRGAEVVIHLAGVVSAVGEAAFIAGNVEGTRIIGEAAAACGARLVHISSLAAGGPAPASAPRSEADPPSPINAYGRSKLASERALAAIRGLHWTALRPGVVYGPGDRAMLPLFRMARRGVLPVVGRTGAAYSIVHVDDLVRAIAAAAERGAPGDILYVGHPRPVTARELVAAVGAAVGGRIRLIGVPMTLTRAAALAGDVAGHVTGRPALIDSRRYAELAAEGFVCRVDRLREHLGIVPAIELQDGMNETADWYRREGWL